MATLMFRTALCDVLGIDYPIVQSGMGGVAGPEMVAEVSRAGGVGTRVESARVWRCSARAAAVKGGHHGQAEDHELEHRAPR